MLIKVKGYSHTNGIISIELTKNDKTGLELEATDIPPKEIFKLQKINGAELIGVDITNVNFESGSAPGSFDGLFKLTFTKTGIVEGDILVLGGIDGVIKAPFERIYNTVTVDGGLGVIKETDTTTISMVAPNHNHTKEKPYNLLINTLTEDGLAKSAVVVPLKDDLIINGIAVASVKLTQATGGTRLNKGEKIDFKVTFHSNEDGTSAPLNFDGSVSDYLAIAFDYKG